MADKNLSLSIVIPVYNEERYLPACLGAIKKQTVKPLEVIVVDNNSTDKTVSIAKQYKFVKVLHEKRQHQAFAQKTGFDNAKGDILGRIDADSILPNDWVEKVLAEFNKDDSLAAITGKPYPYDVFLKKVHVGIFDFYNFIASRLAGIRVIWGANCAIRRTSWKKISANVLQRPDIWEDFDLAFCLKGHGKVKYVKGIVVCTSFRAAHQSLPHQIRYHIRSFRTFYLRTSMLATILFTISRATAVLCAPITFADFYILQPIKRQLASGKTSKTSN